MRSIFLYFIIVILIFQGCKAHSQEIVNKTETTKSPCTSRLEENLPNQQWACYVTTRNWDSLATLYTNNAIKVRTSGAVFTIPDAIKEYYAKKEVVIQTIYTAKRIKANPIYDYEIGGFNLQSGESYKYLLIWNTEGTQKRQLECIAQATKNIPIDPQIEKRRAQWIKLCNAHDALALVTQLYTPNAVYYNHKPLVIGTQAIAQEYSYMNQTQYSLGLTPLHLEMVTSTLAFEMGQCTGGYNGKYLLVWQKNEQGLWQVLFDSNI
ncbi:MAG: hypothetical protein R2781_09255 [Flavobacteriaceae bacterium]